MGYVSWHDYGYGICVADIGEVPVERIERLLECAPEFQAEVKLWLEKHEISEPTYEDYLDFDEDCQRGLATILSSVIEEAEGICFTACDEYDGDDYLIYQASYPWNLPENERGLTEQKVKEILSKYVNMLTDKEIVIDYQSVENGG